MNRKAAKRRYAHGFSITELLVTTLLMGLSMAVIGELAVVTTMGSVKMTNKADGLSAARVAMNRISTDVRHARAVGDYYGANAERSRFPASTNPLYGSRFPAGGWPALPWNPNMTLSDSVLVLQIPVTYENPGNQDDPTNGFPIMLPANYFGPQQPKYNMENLDTVVYQIVPDRNRPGEFILEMARFPGEQITGLLSNSKGIINPPQIILKGITGPMKAAETLPSVFSYMTRTKKPYAVGGQPNPFVKVDPASVDLDMVQGVAFDLEVKSTGLKNSAGDGQFPQYFGIHNEAFMRSNRNMTLNNTGLVP